MGYITGDARLSWTVRYGSVRFVLLCARAACPWLQQKDGGCSAEDGTPVLDESKSESERILGHSSPGSAGSDL